MKIEKKYYKANEVAEIIGRTRMQIIRVSNSLGIKRVKGKKYRLEDVNKIVDHYYPLDQLKRVAEFKRLELVKI